jgi:hypothetical protein
LAAPFFAIHTLLSMSVYAVVFLSARRAARDGL